MAADGYLPEMADTVAAHLRAGSRVRLDILRRPHLVADASRKYVARNGDGQPLAFVEWSSKVDPQAARRAAERAAEVALAIGPELASPVVAPQVVGDFDGCSCSVARYLRPMSQRIPLRRLQRYLLTGPILEWLSAATLATVRPVPAEDREILCWRPLGLMCEHPGLPPEIHHAARASMGLMERGNVPHVSTFAHNDFWIGNVLLEPTAGRYKFGIVDWGGAAVVGHGIYDLLRFAKSLGLDHRRLRKQIEVHCAALGTSAEGARVHAFKALGSLGLNLKFWPVENFARTAVEVHESLISVGL